MHFPRQFAFATAIALICIARASHPANAQDDPLVTDEERHLAINEPDRFAWMLFERINAAVPDDPQRRVLWETWALASDVFSNPNEAPKWKGADKGVRRTRQLEVLPLQQRMRLREVREDSDDAGPEFDPVAAAGQFNETRMNRATFDYVVENELYHIEGQEAFFHRNENLDFPLAAKETKAQWRRIQPADADRYHTAETINDDGSKQLWGLTSLHITTKDLPNWFWATFEHKDNPGREAVVPSRDSSGLPEELKGTKWANYLLRGTQVDFVDPVGRPTILANSQIERGFQRTSSCITCHARATIGERPLNGTDVNRLSIFEGEDGSIGIPRPEWFLDTDRVPASREYVQLDFVWSLFRAQRKSTELGNAAGVGIDVDAQAGGEAQQPGKEIAPREPVEQFDAPQFSIELPEAGRLIRAVEARRTFGVSGRGLTVAVLDTGLRTSHVDFAGRVVTQKNFTSDNGGDENNAADGDGHGTNVGGIIVANEDHVGIAPEAGIVPLKVLRNDGGGSFNAIRDALQWVLDNHRRHRITVVNMSLGDSGNYTSDNFGSDAIGSLIRQLKDRRIAVVVAAGNDFFTHDSQQGMGYPAIFRQTVSVGSVYDADEGPFRYSSGGVAHSSAPDQLTPFTQRLHESVASATRTDVFAPGAPITSSGIRNDNGESVQHGTSQATPVTAGVILLLQQYHQRETGELPTVDQIETWLRRSAVRIRDVDENDDIDNVENTGREFLRIDALGALRSVQADFQRRLLKTGRPLKSQ